MTDLNTQGSRPLKRKHGLGWVPWVAVIGLLATALFVYLVVTNVTDENDAAGIDVSDDEISATSPKADDKKHLGGTGMTDRMGANEDAQVQVRTANGVDVLALASAGRLADVRDADVSASNVTVTNVVANEGFWIGTSTDQLFVYLTAAARGAGESATQVRAGQKLDLKGSMRSTPADVSTLGVDASEGSGRLQAQGVYLEAGSMHIR